MAGKGNSGKFAGKADAKSMKRVKKTLQRTELTLGGIRRLARKGGVKRISGGVYEEITDFVDYYLTLVVKNSAVFAEHARRKTITTIDVVYGLKKLGRTIYGYGM